MFIKELAVEQNKDRKLKLIPKTTEEYISFRFGCLRFIDSLRFFQKGLDDVAKSMSPDKFKYMKEAIENCITIKNKEKGFERIISI
jgi:hypothetical protein